MRAVAIVSMGLALAACVVMAAKGTGSTQEQDSMMSTPEEMVFLVFTETCYNKLVVHREFDMPCAKKTLAKVLGYGITVGAAIVKMPQILNMVLAGSAGGISFLATFTELLGNMWAAAYNAQLGNPLSSYGEAPLVAIQNLAILVLVVVLGPGAALKPAGKEKGKGKGKAKGKGAMAGGVSALSLALYVILFGVAVLLPWFVTLNEFVQTRGGGDPYALLDVSAALSFVLGRVGVVKPGPEALTLLRYLYMANTALFTSSRLPQIMTNMSNGHMGTQSIITLLLQALGVTARIFTAATETSDDSLVIYSFVLSAALNWALVVQFALFFSSTMKWRKDQTKED